MKKTNPYMNNNINFCGNNFYIDERVYVPTKETELFTNEAIEQITQIKRSNFYPFTVEVGTGCGAIGISAAVKTRTRILGLDISEDALAVAEINKIRVNRAHPNEKNITGTYRVRLSDYVRSVAETPDLIIADLPWGNEDYLLKSNANRDCSRMPAISLFPKDGDPMGCYMALAKQIIEKNWETTALIETGNIPESLVRSSLESEHVKVEYMQKKKGYSITKLLFDGKNEIRGPEGHYHLLYYAEVGNKHTAEEEKIKQIKMLDNESVLRNFLYKSLEISDMHCLVEPLLTKSNRNAWTGLMGIITSHATFHLWTDENGPMKKPGVQFDLYSCKNFDESKIVEFLDTFFGTAKSSHIYIDRSLGFEQSAQ